MSDGTQESSAFEFFSATLVLTDVRVAGHLRLAAVSCGITVPLGEVLGALQAP